MSERTFGPLPGAWQSALSLLTSVVLAAAVFAADLASGAEVSFSFFYLVPIALAAWNLGRGAGVALALLCAGSWATAYFLAGQFYSNPHIVYWNAGVELAVFLTAVLTVDSLRRSVARRNALTQQLEIAYRRLDREFELVGDIQRALLPPVVPQPRGYGIAVHYATSARAGGDFYDFFELPDGRLGVFMADVSGHGPPAAVVTAILRVLLRADDGALADPERLLESLNVGLAAHTLQHQFATACYSTLAADSGELEYAIAGHNPPLRLSAKGVEVLELDNPSGPPLGVVAGARFARRSVRLERGDTVLFYTDGLTEAFDAAGEMFGIERVRELMLACRDASPEALRDRLVETVDHHAGGGAQADDITLVVIRCAVAPRTAGQAAERRPIGVSTPPAERSPAPRP